MMLELFKSSNGNNSLAASSFSGQRTELVKLVVRAGSTSIGMLLGAPTHATDAVSCTGCDPIRCSGGPFADVTERWFAT